MTGWQAVLLGIIQGLTEFLPISSSGHLVLAEAVLGIRNNDIAFEIFAHFGTLLAVVTVFKSDFAKIFNELRTILFSRSDIQLSETKNPGIRLLTYLIVGTLPAAFIGYLLRGEIESAFARPDFVSIALIGTGIILLISRITKDPTRELTLGSSVVVGIAQVIAFLPGISRSGTTISAGLLLGVHPIESARFSFLLAVPLILGVTAYKLAELVATPPSNEEIFTLVLGCVMAYLSGLLAIKWLLGILQKNRLDLFAYYCFGVGIFGLIAYNF
ncbi:undecaprenyl-diphosphate phosphatase [candidate division KSB1 bacterium]|nr:undecaprenyl-diphosphate phosphatase [candidate division KSB1 bacterium]NIR70475.1 undecaprenyl-diphosphate phosphatase [candidate division KSB1 bacterium]NIS27653.1 undecaprenyl-diphosphate phosphatase [candidate division KSB1 bacterium]NIT74488.1 undecaprenyl-diphosphate phosphatase [candidate division KSB1 bacterium]NIU28334.1 undecaprenyl-diphosphate phosphatase [candidate division KSB1 bacterium]